MLEAIDRSTVRLRNLVDDVFTLAKLESGAFTTVMRPVDLTDVARAAAEAVRPSVIAGELALTISATDGELMVDGDASQLDRVVINLLSNAVKFTPKGGCVELSAFAEGRSAVIRVRDTGIGIPASDQKELFNRFFRASNATGRSIPGTGLGLAIVRMIVVNHGGDVDLRSTERVASAAAAGRGLSRRSRRPCPAWRSPARPGGPRPGRAVPGPGPGPGNSANPLWPLIPPE
jgi:signal transduction histidine kinase